MPIRFIPFINGDYYHIFNRGLEKKRIFDNSRDYARFIDSLFYYSIQDPKPKFSLYQQTKNFPINEKNTIVEIHAYCLMPNHFHLLLKQRQKGGISEFMRRFIHSYTKYRNVKYQRQGPVFQGVFKAVRIETDEQLLHVSRYIHLNPLVAALIKDLRFYRWSSYHNYVNEGNSDNIVTKDILHFFSDSQDYNNFILDQADYGRTLEILKHNKIVIDSNNPGL